MHLISFWGSVDGSTALGTGVKPIEKTEIRRKAAEALRKAGAPPQKQNQIKGQRPTEAPTSTEEPTPTEEPREIVNPTTALDISSGPPGSTANLEGTGFYPNKPVTVTESGPAGSRKVGVVTADASGIFSMTFQVGNSTPAGRITLTFRQKPDVKVTDTFYVTACDGCPVKPNYDEPDTKKNTPSEKPTEQSTAAARKAPTTQPSKTQTSAPTETGASPVPWATLAPRATSAPETSPSANR
jgi:hypothetical protein